MIRQENVALQAGLGALAGVVATYVARKLFGTGARRAKRASLHYAFGIGGGALYGVALALGQSAFIQPQPSPMRPLPKDWALIPYQPQLPAPPGMVEHWPH